MSVSLWEKDIGSRLSVVVRRRQKVVSSGWIAGFVCRILRSAIDSRVQTGMRMGVYWFGSSRSQG